MTEPTDEPIRSPRLSGTVSVRARRADLALLVLELVGVEDGPADPLDQLTREVVRLEIAQADALAVYDRASGVVVDVGQYEYLRHDVFLPLGVVESSLPAESQWQVKDA